MLIRGIGVEPSSAGTKEKSDLEIDLGHISSVCVCRGGSRICGKGGAAATASAAGAKVFGGSRLKTLFGISTGGARAPPPAPPPP